MSDYQWPYGGTYDLYRNWTDLAHISNVNLYLNDLPASGSTEVVVSPVMALPVQPAELKNPAIVLGGRTLTVPAVLKSGDFLEIEPDGLATHYDDKGDLLARVRFPVDGLPTMRPGVNLVAFDCEKPQGVSARAEVTLNPLGVPFGSLNSPDKILWRHLGREYEMPRWITAASGEENAWDLAVRPGEQARLEVELSGVMDAPTLGIGGREVRFPVTLRQNDRLTCRDGRHWIVTDEKRAVVTQGELSGPLPTVMAGTTRVSFACLGPDRAMVRLVKVYEPK
jgi:hypothetical protein